MKVNSAEYKILAIDDVVTNTLLLEVLLKKEGFNVLVANSGEEGLAVIASEMPDLILLDILMPGIDGFEVVRELKKDSKFREIPILFLTALSNSTDIVKGFQMGVNDYITKPFNKEELMARIMHQLSLLAAKRTIVKRTRELKNTVSARDKMYSVIAHDLRSPMASMKMIMNMLVHELDAKCIGEDMYELLHSANRTTEDVYQLLDNLLKWTKSQIGKLTVVPQNVYIVSLTRGVVDVFREVGVLKNISIEFDSIPEVEAYTDIDMLKSCIRNLLSNAIKFSYNNSQIKVSISETPTEYVWAVADTGCGINSESQCKLMDVSTHFTTYGTSQEEGAGLGLLLTQEFITRNQGRLWFESQEGVGSTFFFSLPKDIHTHD